MAKSFPVIGALPLAWLLPNHYYPWLSAWQDGLALTLLLVATVLNRQPAMIARHWTWFVGISVVAVTVQFACGRVFFLGDAAAAILYLGAFFLAIALGSACTTSAQGQRQTLDHLLISMLFAALLSVGIGLVQWTGAVSLGIWAVDLAPGGRPYGNVAQPNHLTTICLLGLVGAGFLRQANRIGAAVFMLAAAWFLLGMVMSGSRTGWLQIGALVGLVCALGPRTGLALSRRGVVALALGYAALVAAWPALNTLVGLEEGRTFADAMQGGTRGRHWAAMLAAIGREPLWGQGWQQVSAAQVLGADTQPFVGEYIEHSHNILLDLLVWNGLPIGTLLIVLAIGWYVSRLSGCHDPRSLWLMAAITGLGAHAMVEFPLEYAYFLMPLGLLIGAVDAMEQAPRRLVVRLGALRAAGIGLLVAFGWIAVEYLKAEQAHRMLRLESARIGAPGLQTPPPPLIVLTQLEAFLRFAHTEASAGMSKAEIDFMRHVAQRYAYPPVLFRYALAAGLNGQASQAQLTLQRLCRIHPIERCEEARQAWIHMMSRYPVLQVVPAPAMPATQHR